MAITIQRTPELSRAFANEHIRPEVAHQQTADKIQKDVQQQDQQVMKTNKSEENNVNPDGKGYGGGGGTGKKKRNSENGTETPDKKKKAEKRAGMFDISI